MLQRIIEPLAAWLRGERNNPSRSTALRGAFLAAVAIKGFDGLVETAAAVFLALTGTRRLYSLVVKITAPELDFRPASGAIHAMRHGAAALAHGSGRFIVIWLLAHGIIKLVLAIELLRGRTWVFPTAAVVLAGFVIYMSSRLVGHWSLWLLAFALLDVVTIALILNEWSTRSTGSPAPV